jgi:hypothetical protein
VILVRSEGAFGSREEISSGCGAGLEVAEVRGTVKTIKGIEKVIERIGLGVKLSVSLWLSLWL